MINREAIMTALFGLVSGAAAFNLAQRRFKLWNEVGSGSKPALFMYERGDVYVQKGEGIPPIVTMEADIYIYIDAGKDESIAPITVLNPLIDAVELALMPTAAMRYRQTLGGLVTHCWIEGKVLKDPGDLDGDGVAIIPIRIVATV